MRFFAVKKLMAGKKISVLLHLILVKRPRSDISVLVESLGIFKIYIKLVVNASKMLMKINKELRIY